MKDFSLEPGMLYIRKQGPREDLVFETDEKWRMRQIGKFEGNVFGPYHNFYHECLRDECDTAGDGSLISIRFAADGDLFLFLSSYESKRVYLEEWVKEICLLEDLLDAEKERIKVIAKQFGGAT